MPIIKIEGFSKKSLLSLQFDTLLNQKKSNYIPEEDFDLYLYKSKSLKNVFYSAIRIVKQPVGYKVIGYNPLEKFFRIKNVGSTETISVKVTDDVFIQEPKFFSNTNKIVNYENNFNSIQEIYNFIIQYGEYLKDFGIVTDNFQEITEWRTLGKQLVLWAKDITRTVGDYFIASPSKSKILVNLNHGFLNNLESNIVNNPIAIGNNNEIINLDRLDISRIDNLTTIKSEQDLYGLFLNSCEYEHAIIVNKITQFNDVIFDNILGNKKPRVKIIGKKTVDWKGRPSAEGYIVKNNTIIDNFESSANNFSQYNAIESNITNNALQKTARYNVGYTKPEFLQNLNISNDLAFDFYLGSIHDKGTDAVFNKLLRNNNLFNKKSDYQINTKDEWLFRLGELGDVEGSDTIEFELPKQLVKTNPQIIEFLKQYDSNKDLQADDKISILNNDKKWIWTPKYQPVLTHKFYLGLLTDSQQNFAPLLI